tara:strand:+ start:52 stop:726 length:675 start_codon:yes stop_codon:yes gene_type:complete
MEIGMKELNQQIFNFENNKSLNANDFFVSRSNYYAYQLVNSWPKWEKKIVNICGEKYSGKSHLSNIFIQKFKGRIIYANTLNNETLNSLKVYENIVLENFSKSVNENLIYSLFNLMDQDNKYLVINSQIPINEIDFKLDDLKSRLKNCLVAKIQNPDDEMIYALIVKNFADRQISLDKKLIDFIIKRIDRSYGKIFEFIYKIDEISLKKKKSINLNIIKQTLKD